MTDARDPATTIGSELTAQSELHHSINEPCVSPQLPLAQPDSDSALASDSTISKAEAFLADESGKLRILIKLAI